MKFVCSQNDFSNNLSLVSRAVPTRPTHPILANVLMVADIVKQKISLTAFDLSLGIETSFDANISEGGQTTLPAKLLNDIVSRLPEGEISLISEETKDNQTNLLYLKSASGKFQIRTISADEFPPLPMIENDDFIELPTITITEGLRGVLFASSNDELKQVLTGVHLKGTADSLEFAATDGHRLSVVEAMFSSEIDNKKEQTLKTKNSNEFSVTIPAKALRELEKIIHNNNDFEVIQLQIDDLQVIFYLGKQKLTIRKLDGNYPKYSMLIPQKFEHVISLDRKNFLNSLERVAVLASQKNNLVKCVFNNKKQIILLSVETQDLGSAEESIEAKITGESGDIAFNIKYLMDGLKALSTKEIKMQLNEGNKPVIFNPLGGLKMTYLVMPVQMVK
ncbi:DNA polymerase III subunit beta [Candidatus Atelocyanobacterium thalassae]|uniref:Beta sliding clamp n=1 Tax=Atelocyanobacterium thalassa (isolate ALOHA) TaxID=1453429 RepID=D3EN32_ATETH|nr:DNA polymerase III subunit beta [Candidatus Atelocyanobacterium thalassa]ADB94882.1 DNA polymerase III, beta subunit [Candidatus Atelocyanobacterium thalassa isolate ALOHA]MCH2542965.1 DNA polymerase III subunit beta [Candidatus Atelocyanobacterium sp. ALOHA_A2.5_9]|tara:strand:- start:1052 stop:2227 length:1176 start_codon:yes stop_codon:yes gene_type:complete